MPKNEEAAIAARPEPIALAASLVPALAAAERDHDLAGRFAASSLALVTGAGLLALNVPRSHHGFGLDLGGTADVLRVIAHGSPSTALMLAMHTSTLSHYLLDLRDVPLHGRPSFLEQREWAWSEALRGKFFAVANSEAGAAGNVKNSRAEIREGRLFGTKSFCSAGTNADYFLAAARDEHDVVEYYLAANENVTIDTPWEAVGMRASESVSLRFDGAPILFPLAYRGLIDGANNRHWATVSFAAIFTGIAESLLDDMRKAGGFLQQTAAVDLHLAVQACRAFVSHCAATEPHPINDDYRRLVRDCKLFVTRTLAQQATAAFIAQGGSAYRFASPVSRKVRDLLAGPALRPPLAAGFDEVWQELAK